MANSENCLIHDAREGRAAGKQMFWIVDYASALVLVLAVAIPLGALYKTLGVVRFALLIVAVFAIQLPAWAIYMSPKDCVALTGPSCVAGLGYLIGYYQLLALPLIYVAWRQLRRGQSQRPTP